ncbi:transcriptional regulator [Microlunatus sp. Y2014]|uniref:transcriptional regulator n=1 Tax=Microlunatus sp. Y2014 TaxID=3418488 RepID=UPI003DA71D31
MSDEPIPEVTQPDPLVHAPVRLRLLATLTALPADDALTFPRLAKLLDVTPGNLTSHLRSLEAADYIATTTTGRGRGSVTTVALTPTGRAAFTAYRAWALTLLDSGSAP